MLVGLQNGEAAVENSILKTLKIELPYGPATPLLDIYPKELKSGSQRDFLLPSSLQHYSQQLRCRNNLNVNNGWMYKENVICIIEYFSALKKILPCDNMNKP